MEHTKIDNGDEIALLNAEAEIKLEKPFHIALNQINKLNSLFPDKMKKHVSTVYSKCFDAMCESQDNCLKHIRSLEEEIVSLKEELLMNQHNNDEIYNKGYDDGYYDGVNSEDDEDEDTDEEYINPQR